MLERLAAWFLNTYVADYVGNVDTDQLSIGLMKGWRLCSAIASLAGIASFHSPNQYCTPRCRGVGKPSPEERCTKETKITIRHKIRYGI